MICIISDISYGTLRRTPQACPVLYPCGGGFATYFHRSKERLGPSQIHEQAML
jgi:hypothetical protein